MKRWLLTTLFLVSLGWATAQTGPDCDLDATEIREAWAEVLASAPELGLELDPPPELRLSSRAELHDVLLEETLPVLRRSTDDEELARVQAEQFARAHASMLFAKYAWNEGAVLVSLENIVRQARQLDRPALCSPAAVRAILVHELVHAFDHREHAFDVQLLKLPDADAVAAFNAVIEGHAQLVARSACAARGWNEGFQAFEDAIGALPDEAELASEPALELASRILSATLRTSYVQGERFLAAVEAALGADGVRRAFREPPREQALIFHPEWYLDPASRPEDLADLEAGLDTLEAHVDAAEWNGVRISITPAQLAVALEALPASIVGRIQATLRENAALILQPARPPANRQIVLVLYAFASPDEARFFADCNERVTRDKDERLKQGAVRVLEARYEPLGSPDLEGTFCHKRMSVGGQEQELALVLASRGTLAIELMYLAVPTDLDELAGIVRAAFDAATVESRAPEDEALGADGD